MILNDIKKIYSWLGVLQVILFGPFFLGVGLVLFQIYDDYEILANYNEYKSGVLVVSDKVSEDFMSDGGPSTTFTYSVGIVNGIHIKLGESKVRQYISKKNIQINDTIYIWYRNDGKHSLPRLKDETKIIISRYLHPFGRVLMFFGIPPFIILTIIVRRIKKKYLTDEKK